MFKFGDIGAVVLRDMGNCVPRFRDMFSSLAAHSAHGHALNLSPLGEVGQLGRNEMSGAGWGLCGSGHRHERSLGVRLYIVFTDPSAGARSLDLVNINTEFPRETARVRSRRNGFPMFSSSDLPSWIGMEKAAGRG